MDLRRGRSALGIRALPAGRTGRWSVAACLVAAAVAATGCGGGGGGGGQVEHGQEIFLRICSTCHGKDAKGMPKLGKNLHDNAFIHSKTDEEMVEFLHRGRPASDPDNTRGVDMPPKGGDPTLTDDDLKAVVAYLRTL